MIGDTRKRRVAFFGGSFDPPHVGHVLAVHYVLCVGGFDRVVVVPVFAHAFDKALAPFEHRLRMCELALTHLRRVEVSPIERELGVPTLTLRTLQQLQSMHEDWALRLVIGADVLPELHKWHAFDQVQNLAPPYILGRRGAESVDAPHAYLPEVSSTKVRELLRLGSSGEANRRVEAMVPRSVLDYIRAQHLYES